MQMANFFLCVCTSPWCQGGSLVWLGLGACTPTCNSCSRICCSFRAVHFSSCGSSLNISSVVIFVCSLMWSSLHLGRDSGFPLLFHRIYNSCFCLYICFIISFTLYHFSPCLKYDWCLISGHMFHIYGGHIPGFQLILLFSRNLVLVLAFSWFLAFSIFLWKFSFTFFSTWEVIWTVIKIYIVCHLYCVSACVSQQDRNC